MFHAQFHSGFNYLKVKILQNCNIYCNTTSQPFSFRIL
jgi:hypothetical protein